LDFILNILLKAPSRILLKELKLPPNGSDEVAKTQLSVWVTGHFARLRSLSTTSNDAIAVGVTLPLLIVRGGE
jgi:hypothetical protein